MGHVAEGKRIARPTPMEKVAGFIVDKRKAFYLLYVGLAIFSFFAMNWVDINNDITAYLPPDTETREGMVLMEEEFVTRGTNRVMVDNIPYDQAEGLSRRVAEIDGVESVTFDATSAHYKDGAALLSVSYRGEADDPATLAAYGEMEAILADYDAYITGDVGLDSAAYVAGEMGAVLVVAVVIIFVVLLLTSRTYMEVPVLLLTFGMAALLNMGTNFLLGEISFVSNSVAVVLQLALAIDYAIILCHRYTEEREDRGPRDAVVAALSKAIPEIAGSSLTTMSGLLAMTFMHFRIGMDLGLVLMKAILLSLLSVFTLMPGLLLSFSPLIDRTHHKNFIPKISLWGRLVVKLRYIVPPIFALLLVAGFFLTNQCPFAFGYSKLITNAQNELQLTQKKVNDAFGSTNALALVVPAGDYQREGALAAELERYPEVLSVTGLANTEAMDGYMLTDKLTPRQFSELADLDVEQARLLYSAYAVEQETYGELVGGLDSYGVPLIDMFLFVHDQADAGFFALEGDMGEMLDTLYTALTGAKEQLQGPNYSRLLVELDLPEESDETFAFLDVIHEVAQHYYGDETVYTVGASTSDRDLAASFGQDNLLISILTIVFVVLVLVFTFQSAGLPVLLIVVIQGSIWINFAVPTLQNQPLFFLGYIIVSSIQMGANIDYAIVLTNRYMDLRKTQAPKAAVVEALNGAFPTIITSGTIMASAGLLIGMLSSDPAIATLGTCIGRGTIVSIILVMLVLPQLLVLGDKIIQKTAFTLHDAAPVHSRAGSMRLAGHVRGYVSGVVDADIRGTLVGELEGAVRSGTVTGGETAPADPMEGLPADVLEDLMALDSAGEEAARDEE